MTHQLNDELKLKTIEYPEGFRFGAGDDVIVSSEVLQKYLTAQKQAIQSLIEREVRNAQSEILQGFRRRDFVREDIYRTAVTDRLAELNQTNKRSE